MSLPRILFFNINGSGMGHMNRCLSYARRLRGKAEVTFFSLASAIEIIENMGFDAEYYVSQFWSTNSNYIWNTELAFRLSMLLEHVQPQVIVFDGTWPYQGFLAACKMYGKAKLVWSNRGLFKDGIQKSTVNESLFDLILEPGELIDSLMSQADEPEQNANKLKLSPVTLLRTDEILDKATARQELGLCQNEKYALLSLGPGNLRNVDDLGHKCIKILQKMDYKIIVACAPISVQDIHLPEGVMPLTVYPLVRRMRAFDIFMGAAGYNTCCEVVQAQVPAVLLPNIMLADDQAKRAHLVAKNSPTVVCIIEDENSLQNAIQEALLLKRQDITIALDGAEQAAKALLELSKVPDNTIFPAHVWSNGPTWSFILHYTYIASMLQRKLWHKLLFPFMNLWGIYRLRCHKVWQVDLQHAKAEKRQKALVIWSRGLDKKKQRKLCQGVQGFIKANPDFIPVLITDNADFAYFSRLHWLVEYLPELRKRCDSDYLEAKSAYLEYFYANAHDFNTITNWEK